jgi:hypothetical protein
VLELFKGLKEIVFWKDTIQCSADAILVMWECINSNKTIKKQVSLNKPHNFRHTFYRFMKIQQDALSHRQNMGKLDDLFHSRFDGTIIEATCPCRKLEILDEYPRFGTRRPGHYIPRSTRSKCDLCNPQKKDMRLLPRDAALSYTWPDRSALLSFNQTKNTSLEENKLIRSFLLGPSATMGLPAVVEVWCIRHKSETLAKDNTVGPFCDKQPRFTIGHSRHLYVERTYTCQRCIEKRGKTSRFVPKDPAIPSIMIQLLQKYARTFAKYDGIIQAHIFDGLPESSKEPKSSEQDDVIEELEEDGLKSASTDQSRVSALTAQMHGQAAETGLSNQTSTLAFRRSSTKLALPEHKAQGIPSWPKSQKCTLEMFRDAFEISKDNLVGGEDCRLKRERR